MIRFARGEGPAPGGCSGRKLGDHDSLLHDLPIEAGVTRADMGRPRPQPRDRHGQSPRLQGPPRCAHESISDRHAAHHDQPSGRNLPPERRRELPGRSWLARREPTIVTISSLEKRLRKFGLPRPNRTAGRVAEGGERDRIERVVPTAAPGPRPLRSRPAGAPDPWRRPAPGPHRRARPRHCPRQLLIRQSEQLMGAVFRECCRQRFSMYPASEAISQGPAQAIRARFGRRR